MCSISSAGRRRPCVGTLSGVCFGPCAGGVEQPCVCEHPHGVSAPPSGAAHVSALHHVPDLSNKITTGYFCSSCMSTVVDLVRPSKLFHDGLNTEFIRQDLMMLQHFIRCSGPAFPPSFDSNLLPCVLLPPDTQTHTFLCVSRSFFSRNTALSTASRLTFAPGSPFTSRLKLLPGVWSRWTPSSGPTLSCNKHQQQQKSLREEPTKQDESLEAQLVQFHLLTGLWD